MVKLVIFFTRAKSVKIQVLNCTGHSQATTGRQQPYCLIMFMLSIFLGAYSSW